MSAHASHPVFDAQPAPPTAPVAPARTLLGLARDAWRWRHLIGALTLYELKNDKRNNLMGNLWHLLNPVLNMLIFTFVVLVVFDKDIPNYPVLFFCGVTFFRLWTTALSQGASALIAQAGLLRTSHFPRVVVVLPVTLKAVYALFVETLVLAALLVIWRIVPAWTVLLYPVLVAVTALGVTGVVLMLACVGARFRDLSSLIQHVNRLFFYFTPVMYPVSLIPEEYLDYYMLNPVAMCVEMARDITIRGVLPDPGIAIGYTAVCVTLLLVGGQVFLALEKRVMRHL